MRTFSAFDGRSSVVEGNQRKKIVNKDGRLPTKSKKSRAPRPFVSPDEIREKIQERNDKIAAKKAKKIKPPTASEIETKKAPMTANEAADKAKVISDVGDNRPDSEETKEKLKDALKMGSFAFSDKEKKVLASILKNQ